MTEEEKNEILNSYNWIKVKQFNRNDYDTIDGAYSALIKHHIEETTFLINKIMNKCKIVTSKEIVLIIKGSL